MNGEALSIPLAALSALLLSAPPEATQAKAAPHPEEGECGALADLPFLEAALRKYPDSPQLLEALHQCVRALEEELPDGWPDRRRALLKEVAAIQRYQASVEAPDPRADVLLGRVLVRLGKLPEALAAFERAEALEPSSLRGLQGALEVLVRQGRAPEAERRARQWLDAAEGAPARGEGLALLSWVLAEQGRLPEAVACAERSGRADALARAHMRARDWAKAARAWRTWLKGREGAGSAGLLLSLAKLGRRKEIDALIGPERDRRRELLELVLADPELVPLPPQDSEEDLPHGVAPLRPGE